MRTFIILIFVFTAFYSTGQNFIGRRTLGKDYAKRDIKKLTGDSSQYNAAKKKLLIADKKAAVNFADSVLFKEYGKEDILDQKPYEMYLIDNYWWIKGTMSKEAVGDI